MRRLPWPYARVLLSSTLLRPMLGLFTLSHHLHLHRILDVKLLMQRYSVELDLHRPRWTHSVELDLHQQCWTTTLKRCSQQHLALPPLVSTTPYLLVMELNLRVGQRKCNSHKSSLRKPRNKRRILLSTTFSTQAQCHHQNIVPLSTNTLQS